MKFGETEAKKNIQEKKRMKTVKKKNIKIEEEIDDVLKKVTSEGRIFREIRTCRCYFMYNQSDFIFSVWNVVEVVT